METKTQTDKRDVAIRRVIEALKEGRHLSVYDSAEFKASEMHTIFCKIRQKLWTGAVKGYVLKSEWRTNENGIRFKEYWFGKDERVED